MACFQVRSLFLCFLKSLHCYEKDSVCDFSLKMAVLYLGCRCLVFVFNKSSLFLMSGKLDVYNKQKQMLTLATLRHLVQANTCDSVWCRVPCMCWWFSLSLSQTTCITAVIPASPYIKLFSICTSRMRDMSENTDHLWTTEMQVECIEDHRTIKLKTYSIKWLCKSSLNCVFSHFSTNKKKRK